jgi:hypothetical protein
MATIRPIVGLASLFWLALGTAWAQDGMPANPPALPAPRQIIIPANSPALPATTQVKVYRLHYAPPDLLADELYALFAAQSVRVASDPRTNSVIVAGPAAIQANVTGLIARLDVPQTQAPNETFAPGGPTSTAGNVPFEGRRSDTAVKAVELFTGRNALRAGEKIAVVRVSRATARALEAVMPPQPSGQAGTYEVRKPLLDGTFNEAPQLASGPVKTITLSHDEITAIAQALRSRSVQGANGSIVVVVPSEAPATSSRQGTTR